MRPCRLIELQVLRSWLAPRLAAAAGLGLTLLDPVAGAQCTTQILDSTGDGVGNALDLPGGIATDELGNVYVTGLASDNAFQVTPGGTITEIVDFTGDGMGTGSTTPAPSPRTPGAMSTSRAT